MVYSFEQIYEWVRQGQAISPHVMKDIQKYFDEMRNENNRLKSTLLRIAKCEEVFDSTGYQLCKELATDALGGK